MSNINIQVNPTDRFELEQVRDMIEAALLKLKKEEEAREKAYKRMGLNQGLGNLPRVHK